MREKESQKNVEFQKLSDQHVGLSLSRLCPQGNKAAIVGPVYTLSSLRLIGKKEIPFP
jgi:hypothetical protein